MAVRRVLVDAGPLVAMVSQDDAYHERAVAELQRLTPPLLTCWPVLAEAAWLLRRNRVARAALFRAFDSEDMIRLVAIPQSAISWIAAFMDRFASLRPDFGDCALVYLAESTGARTVFTFDRRDFELYRIGRAGRLRIVPDRA